MIWTVSGRFEPPAVALAERHYNRQTPGSPQFVPPGRCLVLLAPQAVWVSSWPAFAQHRWQGAWVNSLFRKEGDGRASDYIRDAVAATRAKWTVPALGMVTFIDPNAVTPRRVRSRPTWGHCYFEAGFIHVGYTDKGLWVMQLLPERMPAADPARETQAELF